MSFLEPVTRPLLRGWDWLHDAPRLRAGIRVLQVVIGLFWLYRLATEGPWYRFLWGPDGIGRGSLARHFGAWARPLDSVFAHDATTALLLAAMGAGAALLLLGRHTRVAALAMLLGQTLLEHRLAIFSDGGDHLCRLVLFWLVLALPPRRPAEPGSLTVWFHNLAVVAIVAQLCVVYLTSGSMKAFGPKWHSGTAMYYISQVEWFSAPWMRGLFSDPILVTVFTIAPMMYQVLFPAAIFSPLRLAWIALGIFFHIGVAVMMGLVNFSVLMIGMILVLVRDREYDRLRAWSVRLFRRTVARDTAQPAWAPRFALYFDGWCPFCRRTVERLRKLDLTHEIEALSFRTDRSWKAHGIGPDALENRLHLVSLDTGEVFAGFEAFVKLATVMPLLWPLVPILLLARALRLGDRAYDALAASRTIVPDPAACGDHCELARPARRLG